MVHKISNKFSGSISTKKSRYMSIGVMHISNVLVPIYCVFARECNENFKTQKEYTCIYEMKLDV